MYHINVDKKRIDLGDLKFISFYFLEGANADFVRGALYAIHNKNFYPLLTEDGKMIRIPEYAEMGARDFKENGKMAELESKIESGKYLIDAAEYNKQWNETMDDDVLAADTSRIPNKAVREKRILSFEEFVFEKEYHDAADRFGTAKLKQILETLLDKKIKKSDLEGEDKTMEHLAKMDAALNDVSIDKLDADNRKYLAGQVGAAHGAGSGVDPEREFHIDTDADRLLIILDDEHELSLPLSSEELSDFYKDINKKQHEAEKKKAAVKTNTGGESTPPAI